MGQRKKEPIIDIMTMITIRVEKAIRYQGKHEPIITKELFDIVQQQIKSSNLTRRDNIELAFTKLMVCGLCGSMISAEEKYKQLKDGTTAKYIYYGCGRSKDRNCKSHYLREEELIEQLIKLFDKIKLNNFGIKVKFEEELKRFNKFQKGVLGIHNKKQHHEDVDMKTYAKYILKHGAKEEKRELMSCFKSKIRITRKVITID